jgi:hypothetical protein
MNKVCEYCKDIFEAYSGHERICPTCRRRSIDREKELKRYRHKHNTQGNSCD